MKPDAAQLEVLKHIAVTAFASDRLSEDTWNSMCAWAASQDYDSLKDSFKVVEKEMKDAYKVTRMPSAWRSAKADIMKAVTLGLEFYDKSESKAVPKSALEARMKKPSTPLTPIGKFMIAAHDVMSTYDKLSAAEKAETMVQSTVASLKSHF